MPEIYFVNRQSVAKDRSLGIIINFSSATDKMSDSLGAVSDMSRQLYL